MIKMPCWKMNFQTISLCSMELSIEGLIEEIKPVDAVKYEFILRKFKHTSIF